MPYPSKATAGRSSKVSIGGVTGASGTEVFTLIGELDSADFSGSSVGTEDVSTFESGVDVEFIATMRDNGELSLGGNDVASDAGQVALYAAYSSLQKYDFKVEKTPPQGSTTGEIRTFSGLVTKFDTGIKVKSANKFTATVKISGLITRTLPV